MDDSQIVVMFREMKRRAQTNLWDMFYIGIMVGSVIGFLISLAGFMLYLRWEVI